ncbi:MAG: helix-turn-helix domain-containing protein, partial [Adlercreutzia sp.]|nr:helix-turn-helix domain-containing protein [Adlercreutzia sp.]
KALMATPARVHTKRNLSAAAAGSEGALEDKAVATHIGNIRAKLREVQAPDLIETVWGVGFKLRDLG